VVEWPAGGAAGAGAREAAARDLMHHVKSSVGITIRVRVADPGGLDRSIGKARRVIDRRPKS